MYLRFGLLFGNALREGQPLFGASCNHQHAGIEKLCFDPLGLQFNDTLGIFQGHLVVAGSESQSCEPVMSFRRSRIVRHELRYDCGRDLGIRLVG